MWAADPSDFAVALLPALRDRPLPFSAAVLRRAHSAPWSRASELMAPRTARLLCHLLHGRRWHAGLRLLAVCPRVVACRGDLFPPNFV